MTQTQYLSFNHLRPKTASHTANYLDKPTIEDDAASTATTNTTNSEHSPPPSRINHHKDSQDKSDNHVKPSQAAESDKPYQTPAFAQPTKSSLSKASSTDKSKAISPQIADEKAEKRKRGSEKAQERYEKAKRELQQKKKVQEDCTLYLPTTDKTYFLRQGQFVCLLPEVTHKDPQLFESPESFQYDRFYSPPDQPPKKFFHHGQEVRYNVIPFGGGVSLCPGRAFAFNEIRLFILICLCNFDFHLEAHQEPVSDPNRAGLGIPPPVTKVPFRLRRIVTPTLSRSAH